MTYPLSRVQQLLCLVIPARAWDWNAPKSPSGPGMLPHSYVAWDAMYSPGQTNTLR